MEKQRIFRSRQNVTFGDLNSIQDYAARTFEDIVNDLLVSGKGYAGFLSTRDSATTVQVGAGRLYAAGRIFAHESTQAVSLSTYLPAAAQRIVTLVTYGQTIESGIEPRDFLINVTTRATEPQSVAMVQERVAQVSVVPGSESADPQRPPIPEAYVPIADVLIGTAGIISVTMRADFAVPELDLARERLDGITAWQLRVGQVLDGLLSDLATLGRRVDSLPTRAEFADLAAQVSALRLALDELRRNITASIEADLSVIKAQMKAFADLVAGQIIAIAGNLAIVKEIHATESQLRVSRAKTTFTHVSSERTLPSGMTTTQLRVVTRLYPFVSAQHTIAVTLLTGAGYATSVAPAAVVTRAVPSSDRADDVEKEFLFSLRGAYINPGAGGLHGSFDFGGITWVNYKGGGSVGIDTNKCHLFPTGVPGLFRTVYGPADYIETVNTPGQRLYGKQWEMMNGKGVNLEFQMNALHYCTRPRVLIPAKRT